MLMTTCATEQVWCNLKYTNKYTGMNAFPPSKVSRKSCCWSVPRL